MLSTSLTKKQITEEALAEACRRKDPKARQKVYDLYAKRMTALCRRYMKEELEAEDVLALGFFKIFTKIDQFNGQGSFEGWMKRIMVNECLNKLRQNKSLFLTASLESAETAALQSDYEAGISLQMEDLMKCVQRLPDGYRTVFNLYALEGYSHKEIAESLQISENTSKSQLSRARTLLQKYVNESEKINTARHG